MIAFSISFFICDMKKYCYPLLDDSLSASIFPGRRNCFSIKRLENCFRMNRIFQKKQFVFSSVIEEHCIGIICKALEKSYVHCAVWRHVCLLVAYHHIIQQL